ncbi:DUF3592 domain-containing protein [Streptomyces sp. UNOB3_S3]|uniref:DUF3592 domain-containing protein n=1 Tax=Streptomyces sp. UNOB3_S3 TaxID=2871682 RepID=UPI001E5ADACB|nr:DUF3592 domain-containing protein [Streptomyces sp. UNOB3_S3]MCC3775074.1 hypothetical protein [Streptomyces sp. UNOB3_S3]
MVGWFIYGFMWLSVFGGLILPFGLRPLLTGRRLRTVGVKVKAECTGRYWSEDRVSEHFAFRTRGGRRVLYRSPLRGSRVAGNGEMVDLVYDPRNPKRARTERELARKSEAWRNLWGGIGLLVAMHVFFLKIFI